MCNRMRDHVTEICVELIELPHLKLSVVPSRFSLEDAEEGATGLKLQVGRNSSHVLDIESAELSGSAWLFRME